jgi:hypothetical protein
LQGGVGGVPIVRSAWTALLNPWQSRRSARCKKRCLKCDPIKQQKCCLNDLLDLWTAELRGCRNALVAFANACIDWVATKRGAGGPHRLLDLDNNGTALGPGLDRFVSPGRRAEWKGRGDRV